MKKFVKSDTSTTPADFSKASRVVFSNLKPTATPISLRLPCSVLDRIKLAAHSRGVPYQSLIKNILADAVALPSPVMAVKRKIKKAA
jgi:predicted DNA binding CopG/RHH family protein